MKKLLLILLISGSMASCVVPDTGGEALPPEENEPVGEFILTGIEYSLREGDGYVIDNEEFFRWEFSNHTDDTVEVVTPYTPDPEEKYRFIPDRHMFGDAVLAENMPLDMPGIADMFGLGTLYGLSDGVYTYNYALFSSGVVARESLTLKIPPGGTLVVTGTAEVYHMQVSYRASFSNNSTQVFRTESGKWTASKVWEVTVRISDKE